MRSSRPVESFAPPLLDPDTLRRLSRDILDAATRAGASFADVRVSDKRFYSPARVGFPGWLEFRTGYGLRVRVDGRDAFVASADVTPEGIVRTATAAVAIGRQLANVAGPSAPLARVPVVTGEWNAAVDIDPFTVSPDEHVFVMSGYTTRRRHRGVMTSVAFQWESETRVMASTEGTSTTQRWTRFLPFAIIDYAHWRTRGHMLSLRVAPFQPGTAGYETVLGPERHEQLEAVVDEFNTLISYPIAVAEVGRKDVVLDGRAHAALLGATMVPALSAARILGEEQNSGGTSFLGSIDRAIGQQVGANGLEMWVDHGNTLYGAMHWDDEGVAAAAVPLIRDGRVVNVLATRTNASAVSQTTPPPLGTAFSPDVMTMPAARPGAFVVRPSASGGSLATLRESLKNGYIVRNAWVGADQQGASGSLYPQLMFEVQKGAIVRRVVDVRLEFSTVKLLRSASAFGGASSMDWDTVSMSGGLPWSETSHFVAAPAVYLRDANIASNSLHV